jgi:predicted Fe-Mo cluster-binding NifX family protein
MRIAISADTNNGLDSQVAHHFGRCPHFVFVNVEEGKVTAFEVIDNPFYSNHQPGQVPAFIHEQGAEVMVSGGIGRRAMEFFQHYGIQIGTGASGTAGEALQKLLAGELSSVTPCRQSEEHYKQGHHH